MWFLTYRDKSPLQAGDWLGFRDPDRLTYRTYVTMQDEQETVVERVLDEYGPAGHDASLPGPWAEGLATLFTPTRFPVHALQMCTADLGQMAPASYISNCAVFGAGDLLRRVSLVAYRTRQLADATSSSIGRTERAMWERNQAWQPARRALAAGALEFYDRWLPSTMRRITDITHACMPQCVMLRGPGDWAAVPRYR